MIKNSNRLFGNRMFAKGLYVSNDTYSTGLNNNDLIIGGSGSGKTGGYIYNALEHPCGCSMIVSDTKGLLCRMFSEKLKKQGYKVTVLDFVNPENSASYNPLSYIRRNSKGQIVDRDIKKIANVIMPVLDTNEPFWEKSAVRYISMLIGYILENNDEEEQNMHFVAAMHRKVMEGVGKRALQMFSKAYPDSYAAKRFSEMTGSSSADKMWSSIMEFSNEALEPFEYRDYSNIFNKEDTIDIEAIGREKTVVFVNTSDHDTSFHVLSNIFFAQTLQILMDEADHNENGRLDIPCRLIMDDFAAGPAIEDFENIISVIRSRDISVSVIIQSISQLEDKYSGNTSRTIINNCDHILYLSGHDFDTAHFIANHIDKPVHSILELPADQAVFIEQGSKARYVEKLEPYGGMSESSGKEI